MDKFKSFFQQFREIQHSYNGIEKTNWKEKQMELEKLSRQLKAVKINSSENAPYYEWIKRKLKEEIETEITRVWKLTL